MGDQLWARSARRFDVLVGVEFVICERVRIDLGLRLLLDVYMLRLLASYNACCSNLIYGFCT